MNQAHQHQEPLILVVDDDFACRKVASLMLQKNGYAVEMATDGQEAVQKASQRTYDLILMDCHMPVKNGLEATEEIRQMEASWNRYTPIVALTADLREENKSWCQQAGMDHFIGKPVDLQQLRDAVQFLIKSLNGDSK